MPDVATKTGTLTLIVRATPNPDFPYSSHEGSVSIPPKFIKVENLDDARNQVLSFINQNELGGGNFPEAKVIDETGKFVAVISYNGRVWDINRKEIPQSELMVNGGETMVADSEIGSKVFMLDGKTGTVVGEGDKGGETFFDVELKDGTVRKEVNAKDVRIIPKWMNGGEMGTGGGMQQDWQKRYDEHIYKTLTMAGFDASKLTKEQKDVIVEPSEAPENYAADGELSPDEAFIRWKARLKRSGLNDEQIRKAIKMHFGRKMDGGGDMETETIEEYGIEIEIDGLTEQQQYSFFKKLEELVASGKFKERAELKKEGTSKIEVEIKGLTKEEYNSFFEKVKEIKSQHEGAQMRIGGDMQGAMCKQEPKFKEGDIVKHATHGTGEVLNLLPKSMVEEGGYKYNVMFPDYNNKEVGEGELVLAEFSTDGQMLRGGEMSVADKDKIKEIMKTHPFMQLDKPLKEAGFKVRVSMNDMPLPPVMYVVEKGSGKVGIVNKEYVTGYEFEHNGVAMGDMAEGGEMRFGGRIPSAFARDRKYTSEQEHEQAYKPERVSPVRYYKHEGGNLEDDDIDDLIEDKEAEAYKYFADKGEVPTRRDIRDYVATRLTERTGMDYGMAYAVAEDELFDNGDEMRTGGEAKRRRKKALPSISEVKENGEFIENYPVDEDMNTSNAGDAEVYKYKGKWYQIITWNMMAMEHEQGEQEIADVTESYIDNGVELDEVLRTGGRLKMDGGGEAEGKNWVIDRDYLIREFGIEDKGTQDEILSKIADMDMSMHQKHDWIEENYSSGGSMAGGGEVQEDKFKVKKLGVEHYKYGLYYDNALVSGLLSDSPEEVEKKKKEIIERWQNENKPSGGSMSTGGEATIEETHLKAWQELSEKVNNGRAVLLASSKYGLPTIHDVSADKNNVRHLGFGVFEGTGKNGGKFTFTAGGAMAQTGDITYTTLSGAVDEVQFNDGTVGYNFEKVKARLQELSGKMAGGGVAVAPFITKMELVEQPMFSEYSLFGDPQKFIDEINSTKEVTVSVRPNTKTSVSVSLQAGKNKYKISNEVEGLKYLVRNERSFMDYNQYTAYYLKPKSLEDIHRHVEENIKKLLPQVQLEGLTLKVEKTAPVMELMAKEGKMETGGSLGILTENKYDAIRHYAQENKPELASRLHELEISIGRDNYAKLHPYVEEAMKENNVPFDLFYTKGEKQFRNGQMPTQDDLVNMLNPNEPLTKIVREFFTKRFGKPEDQPDYFEVWYWRFWAGNERMYMDTESLGIYDEMMEQYAPAMRRGGEAKYSYNPFAVCTTSIGRTEGTRKRSKWSDEAKERYERCVLELKGKYKLAAGGDLKSLYDKTSSMSADEVAALYPLYFEGVKISEDEVTPKHRRELAQNIYEEMYEIGLANTGAEVEYGKGGEAGCGCNHTKAKEQMERIKQMGIGGVLLGAGLGIAGTLAVQELTRKDVKAKAKEKEPAKYTDKWYDERKDEIKKLPSKIRFYDPMEYKSIEDRVYEKYVNGKWVKISHEEYNDIWMLGDGENGRPEYKRKQKSESMKGVRGGEQFVQYLQKSEKLSSGGEATIGEEYGKGGGIKAQSLSRIRQSPLLKYANFKDDSFINLIRLKKTHGGNWKPYKDEMEYGISISAKGKTDAFLFKTLEQAEKRFDELVEERKKHTELREEVKRTQNYNAGGSMAGGGEVPVKKKDGRGGARYKRHDWVAEINWNENILRLKKGVVNIKLKLKKGDKDQWFDFKWVKYPMQANLRIDENLNPVVSIYRVEGGQVNKSTEDRASIKETGDINSFLGR